MREVRQVCESHTNSFENLKSMLGADGCNVGKYHWRTYICTNHLQKRNDLCVARGNKDKHYQCVFFILTLYLGSLQIPSCIPISSSATH